MCRFVFLMAYYLKGSWFGWLMSKLAGCRRWSQQWPGQRDRRVPDVGVTCGAVGRGGCGARSGSCLPHPLPAPAATSPEAQDRVLGHGHPDCLHTPFQQGEAALTTPEKSLLFQLWHIFVRSCLSHAQQYLPTEGLGSPPSRCTNLDCRFPSPATPVACNPAVG